jgi:cell division protein FtsQ
MQVSAANHRSPSTPHRSRKASRPRGNRRRVDRETDEVQCTEDEGVMRGAKGRIGRARIRRSTGHAARSASRRGRDVPLRPARRIAARLARLTARLVVVGGLVYGLLMGAREGYDYATTSPRFEVRALTFTPTKHVDDGRLRELMALRPGTNILALDLDEIAGRIAADPWVAQANVTRVLPDALDVEVVEHEPSAVLLAGGFYLVDEQGQPFKVLESGEREQLPVITGIAREELLSQPEQARDRTRRGLGALRAYNEKRRPRLSEVNIDETGAVTLYTAELGTQLRLGREDVDRALERFDALRAALGEDSDKLAIAHLDASTAAHMPPEGGWPAQTNRKDRVVASFFATREAPTLVAVAHAQVVAKAVAHEAAQQALDTSEGGRKAVSPGEQAKRGRIPRYQ